MSLTAIAASLSSAGCCATEEAQQGPLVIAELGSAKSTVHVGGVMTMEATLEARAPAENVSLDFYATGAKEPSCNQPQHLLAHVSVPRIATSGADLVDVRVVHQRLDKTSIVYDKGVGNRRAKVTRVILLPELAEGDYYLAAAVTVGAERSCKLAAQPIAVKKPFGPQLVLSSMVLANNSFTLPTEEYRPLRNRPAPAFSVSAEVMNTGLDVSVPAEASFTLEWNGKSYPLLVELSDESGAPFLHEHLPLGSSQTADPSANDTFHQNEVRGGTAHVYLGEEARAALGAANQETTGLLKLVLDKDNKLRQMGPTESSISFAVTQLPLGAANGGCAAPGNYANVVFCFGPSGAPWTDKWGPGSIYVEYSLAGNQEDPSYFAHDTMKVGEVDIPYRAEFHAASWVKVGKTEGDATVKTPVDALVEMDYTLPPPQGDDAFFKFDGHLKILGDTRRSFLSLRVRPMESSWPRPWAIRTGSTTARLPILRLTPSSTCSSAWEETQSARAGASPIRASTATAD